jgi:hypothetical protein
VSVTSLSARHVEQSSAGRESEQIDEPADLPPIAAEVEDRLILEQVVLVEVLRPPIGGRRSLCLARGQKKTGSR